MWIHNNKNWSDFTWDTAVVNPRLQEAQARHQAFLALLSTLGFLPHDKPTLNVFSKETLKKRILAEKRHQFLMEQRLYLKTAGLPPAVCSIDGLLKMTLDATQNNDLPLTKKRLCQWQKDLFPRGNNGLYPISVGQWRPVEAGDMEIRERSLHTQGKLIYKAPSSERIDKEMQDFLSWFNAPNNVDSLIKAGIAIFWFLKIHPFEDGNGRIARVLSDMLLARSEKSSHRFYSLSIQIVKERKAYLYYLAKEATSDITLWLSWFLDCFNRCLTNTEIKMRESLKY